MARGSRPLPPQLLLFAPFCELIVITAAPFWEVSWFKRISCLLRSPGAPFVSAVVAGAGAPPSLCHVLYSFLSLAGCAHVHVSAHARTCARTHARARRSLSLSLFGFLQWASCAPMGWTLHPLKLTQTRRFWGQCQSQDGWNSWPSAGTRACAMYPLMDFAWAS